MTTRLAGNPATGAQSRGGILFGIFQNGAKANGGVESVTQIIEGLGETARLVLTNAETPVTERWRRTAAEIVVWTLPYAAGESWRAGGLTALLRRLLSLVATNWWTWRNARRGKIRAVHCNDPAPFWHLAVGAWLAGVPLVLNLRDTKSREEGLNIARYRHRFRLCRRVLVLSREMKEFYEPASYVRKGKRCPPIDYIYSAVDLTRMRPLSLAERRLLRRQLGIQDETFAVGFIASFNDKKNQLAYLRRAAGLLRKLCPAAKTFFVGDFEPESSSYALSCAETSRHLRLDDCIRFVGFCFEVEKWYQACDVVIVPTRKEGLARCMIEALACGTPVVSFDVASAKEILEEQRCGRVVAQGDYEQLCATIAQLAEQPELRQEFSARGVAVARRLFSAEASVNKYRNLICSLHDPAQERIRRLNCFASSGRF